MNSNENKRLLRGNNRTEWIDMPKSRLILFLLTYLASDVIAIVLLRGMWEHPVFGGPGLSILILLITFPGALVENCGIGLLFYLGLALLGILGQHRHFLITYVIFVILLIMNIAAWFFRYPYLLR